MNLNRTITKLFFLLFLPSFIEAQNFADPCFMTAPPSRERFKSENLISINGDLLDWDGSKWNGQWPRANVTLTPPMPEFCDKPVRAIWLGNGTSWQVNGEGFSIRLSEPLVAGQNYTFRFFYVSEGTGSDDHFAPELSTSLYGDHIGYTVGRLRPAGRNWHYDSISFVAVPFQNGDQWITLHTKATGSSGLILAPCPQQKFRIEKDREACAGKEVELKSDRPLLNYMWSTTEDSSSIKVTQTGVYWLESVSPCGIHRDSLELDFRECGAGVGVPLPKAGIKLPRIKINFTLCWKGKCGDDDDPAPGPGSTPSPDVVVYNVITPNGDGYNDVFYIQDVELGNWKLFVFNRWGEVIFEDKQYKNTWYPYEYPDGVYYFILKDRNSDKLIKGVVTIIKS